MVCIKIVFDVVICFNCKSEIFDFLSCWYCYLFINCIYCGFCFSIIKKLFYDCKNMIMVDFDFCLEC